MRKIDLYRSIHLYRSLHICNVHCTRNKCKHCFSCVHCCGCPFTSGEEGRSCFEWLLANGARYNEQQMDEQRAALAAAGDVDM
jgi:hypothetical protein